MAYRILRKAVCDPEFLALPPRVREAIVAIFRELAASQTPVIRGTTYFVEELRQNRRIASEGIYSVHVADRLRGEWKWRGAFLRRGTDLVFFGFGPRDPDFYVRLSRLREAVSRIDDER
jgi:hypothetical protein